MKATGLMTTSWDDGHPLDQRIADLLVKYGLTGTFYIPLENSRPVMPAEEIWKLSRIFEIGAHTVHHAVLTEVPKSVAEAEICESKTRLADITGRPCDAFCFPKGRFRACHLEMVRRAGFRCARTVELLSTRFPDDEGGIYLIPTTVQANNYEWKAYAKNCAKRLNFRNMVHFHLHARSRSWTNMAHGMLDLVAERGGVFHLWGHSWEIAEQQQWVELESVFSEMREFLSIVPCVANSHISPCTRANQTNLITPPENRIPSNEHCTDHPAAK